MNLHSHWKYVLDDAASIGGVAKNAYDVWESIVERHPNAKLFVRCANCTGSLYFLVDRLQKQFKESNPSISCSCPNCGKQINQHSMTYDKLTHM